MPNIEADCSSTDINLNDSIEESLIIAKANEFNTIFKILETSTLEANPKNMIMFLLNGLNKKYPMIVSEFKNSMNEKKSDDSEINNVSSNSNDNNIEKYWGQQSNQHCKWGPSAWKYTSDLMKEKWENDMESFSNNNFDNSSDVAVDGSDYEERMNISSHISSGKRSTNSSNSDSDSDSDSDSNNNERDDNYNSNNHNSNDNRSDRSDNSAKYELLLDPAKRRFTAYPIEFPDIWDMYKVQQAAFWVATEIDFSKDYDDFCTKFSSGEQHFIKMIIAFFANSDGIVNWNLSERFTKDIQITEAIFAYQFQIMMENIHSEVYSLMLENIIKDPKEKDMMFNAIHTIPSIKAMADWAFKWIESDKSFAHRLIAFAIVEGVFFSGAFASIFWIKSHKQNAMPGLTKSNEFIARDEGMHCEFACELYKYIENKLSSKQINKIMDEAVKISQTFMRDALPVRLIAMNQTYMDDYLEYVADRLLQMLSYKKLYNKANPFEFMAKIGLANKDDFFVHRPNNYQECTINNTTSQGCDFSQIDEEWE